MSNKLLKTLIGAVVLSVQWAMPPAASAVGNGIPFIFREGFVPSVGHPVAADSLDFTYHACVNFIDEDTFVEQGYLWISSFQDDDSVVDSQINHYLANGYHLYARYAYSADQWMGAQPTPNGARLNYIVNGGNIGLYSDPLSDTVLSIQNCAVVAMGTADDKFLGFAGAVINGQKSETNDLASGDFELHFANWAFTADGQLLFRDFNDPANTPLVAQILSFNGNVTLLGGPLGQDHKPEGSGNLFWID
jgi:hypothetical protein